MNQLARFSRQKSNTVRIEALQTAWSPSFAIIAAKEVRDKELHAVILQVFAVCMEGLCCGSLFTHSSRLE